MTLLEEREAVGGTRSFVPTPPPAQYDPPDVWVDRDQSKGWIRRLLPILKPHRRVLTGMLLASLVMLGMQLSKIGRAFV